MLKVEKLSTNYHLVIGIVFFAFTLFFFTILFPKGVAPLIISMPETGEYRVFMTSFFHFLKSSNLNRLYDIQDKSVPSPGSIKTIEQINSGKTNFGIVQANTGISSDNVRSIAYVFPEVLFWLSNNPKIVNPYKIKEFIPEPFTIATLEKGSQTYEDLKKVMAFYKYEELIDYKIIEGDHEQGLNKLMSGEVNFVFFISGLGNKFLRDLIEFNNESIRLIPLLNRKAITLRIPGYTPYDIYSGLYGEHFDTYKTIATRATLVCSAHLTEDLVFEMTKDLFRHQAFLKNQFVYLELFPVSNIDQAFFPIHDGARRFFEDDKSTWYDYSVDILVLIGAIFAPIASGVQFIKWIKIRLHNRRITREGK